MHVGAGVGNTNTAMMTSGKRAGGYGVSRGLLLGVVEVRGIECATYVSFYRTQRSWRQSNANQTTFGPDSDLISCL